MAALPAWNLLQGKTAAITGGTTGIGRAIVLAYITQGCNVAVNHLGLAQDEGHRHSLLKEVKAIKSQAGINTGEILELPGDVTDPETSAKLVQQAVSRWGKLDVFVANAGVFKQAEFLKLVLKTIYRLRQDARDGTAMRSFGPPRSMR
jgi:L-rhamnose 1-dehydrogenase